MQRSPTIAEIHSSSMEALNRQREIADAEWPKQFRMQCEANDLELARFANEFLSDVQRVVGNLAQAHNTLADQVASLKRDLDDERAARQKLEALPRQTINVTVPERAVNVTNEVQPAEVHLATRPVERTTDVEYGDDPATGRRRITRTVSTEKPI